MASDDDDPWCFDPTPGLRFNYDTTRIVWLIYLIFIVIWIAIIVWGGFYRSDPFVILILAIPILVFSINLYNTSHHTSAVASTMLKSNVLSFLFLSVSILVNWFGSGERKRIFRALIISVFFILVSLLDIWVSEDKLIYVVHIKTALQTIALTLLIYALYIRFRDNLTTIEAKKKLGYMLNKHELDPKTNKTTKD